MSRRELLPVLALATGVGVLSGMFGLGGGVILVPALVLLFGFPQHLAQGTSLVALVPPTGLLAFLNYWRAGHVDWRLGLLVMRGVFLGGWVGGKLAQRMTPKRMKFVFAGLLFLLGLWQVFSVWVF